MTTLILIIATLAAALYFALDYYFAFINLYYLIIGFFGLKYTKPTDLEIEKILNPSNFNKFALLICAHNEKYVIENTIEQMSKLNYPVDKHDIIIVCDNCSDDTFDLATEKIKKYPNFHVLKRTNDTKKGKPYAVSFGMEWINGNLEYDALSIADADNVYERNYFMFMNNKLNNGSKIIQGLLGVKNPFDTMVSSSITFCYYQAYRTYFIARRNLGLPTTLGGTGFVVEKNTIKEIGWDMTSLVEDLEFSTKCVINGYDIDFCYEAKTFDEKPLDMVTSIKQRSRWMQGHWWVCFNYSKKLIAAFKNPKANKYGLFDYLMYLWIPVASIVNVVYLFLPFLISYLGFIPIYIQSLAFYTFWLRIVLYFLQKGLEYTVVLQEGYGWKNIWRSLHFYYIHTIDWIIATYLGLSKYKEQGNWDKTLHTKIVDIEKLEAQQN
jgi:cellulose synthase/poly-beta-1,6-N-acetylglucosamine synthase-like glycosyltransferase